MPGRSGVSLLNRIRNERPDIVRMLTTAYADLDSAIEAVNKGEILRYISKPWDLRVLEAEIEQALTFYLLKNEYDLLLRDKLSALHRTLLRDRMNAMAVMSGMLPYNNGARTMYNYLKDALSEAAWRPAVQKQWSQLRAQDHWRIPLDEAQRMITLSEELMDEALVRAQNADDQTDLLSVINDCAEAVNHDFGEQQVRVTGGSAPIHIPVSRTLTEGIMQRLMEPMSRWAAIGSTLQINVDKRSSEGADDNVVILFEARNCEAGKSVQDCVLFAPALQATPSRASEFLKASLAIGHVGGTISSPPMENGFKQIHVTLPANAAGGAKDFEGVPHQWLQDLSDEYEKWVLGTLEVA
jgi:two-component system probable response regulator PhcQ